MIRRPPRSTLFPTRRSSDLGFDLLDLFEREQQLIFRQGLGPAAEAMTLQFLDDLAQPLALGALGHEHPGERASRWSQDEVDHASALPAMALRGVRSTRRRRRRDLARLMHTPPIQAFEQSRELSRRQVKGALLHL